MAYPVPTGAPPQQTRHTHAARRRGVLLPVVGLVALGICGLVVIGLVGSSVGVGGVLVGALCALLPVSVVVATFLWLDRWEPEPPRMLLFAFLWGACFAALSALLINSSAALAADALLGRGSGDVLGSVLIAPFVEEAVKGLFLVGLLVWRRREFDGIVDGVVYAGIVAAGFAFTENILYFGRAFAESDAAGPAGAVAATFILRGVLSPFAHPLFTSMIGIGAGIAASKRSVVVRILAVLAGYLLAVLLHAVWNGAATVLEGGFFQVYILVMLPLFLAMAGIVIWQRRREAKTVADQLPSFAQAGWIAWSEVPLLGNLARRKGWRREVRRRSGPHAARAVADYQAAVTELAFLRARIARGAVRDSAEELLSGRLRELAKARARALGMPDALTAAWGGDHPPGWAPPAPHTISAPMPQAPPPGYAPPAYAPQPYPQHPGQPYPQHPGQPYPGQPYPGQQYPGQQYPGQPYPPQPYPGPQGPTFGAPGLPDRRQGPAS
ncbi:PrsW family intramembrane metalloprotease [Pseudonocardia sp. WMMC193]|uniref:PrsW family intramembrane metalloprotease n=1 Tax=Pseudonocardia sp. WMMC193 TaxID=2911965 RepID=UPI001F33F20C|nr:PrsW family intramembrane metalloprotease [Pseudonocardia sp. WMMC193]MCF7552515.1 PrsW family intramembrane metalloprotease [Pseudonocardia sp. WMMC193]